MRRVLLLACLLAATPAQAQLTFFGSSAVPADGAAASNTTTQITITPPASMVAGDLVYVECFQRGTATFSVGVAGGQQWAPLTRTTGSSIAVQGFWARYTGTWTANPRFDFSSGTNTSAVMLVFRPNSGASMWAVSTADTVGSFTAPTTPFTVTRPGVTRPASGHNVTLAMWATADDNTWGSLSGSGWSQTSLSAQYRNTAGSDASLAFAYNIGTGASNNVSLNQASLGGDAGVTRIVTFSEVRRRNQ